MQLNSDAFQNGQRLPNEFTCDGPGVSPPLYWLEPPTGTHAFALIADDPDARRGVFTHWLIYNIPGDRLQALDWAVPAVHGLQQTGTAPVVETVTDAADLSWPRENLPPLRPWHDLLRPGQRVFSFDGVELGRIKLVEEQRFLLDRSLARDRWVPYRYLDHVDADTVRLSPTSATFDALGLEEPPLT